jgi:hypothetical protein
MSSDKQQPKQQGAPSTAPPPPAPPSDDSPGVGAPAPQVVPPPASPSPRYVPLLSGRLRTLEQANNSWAVVLPAGTPFATALDEKYWSNVAGLFKMFDRVVVNADDGAFTATLHVRAAGRGWAKMAVLDYHELGAAIAVKESDTHTVAFRGAYAMWCVIRRADSEVIKDKFATPEEARAWMAGHLRALAA